MKRTIPLLLLTVAALTTALVNSESVSSNASFVTTLNVDRTDDTAAATACTVAANDCSLRGAIIKANSTPGADPFVINLQPATTYNLTLANATQENAAATGDLDVTTGVHSVTVKGGGSSGPNASVIDAAGLNSGNMRDRIFHVTGQNVTLVLEDLSIRNGKAADGGNSGASTNPTAQNTNRTGGGILNNGGTLTLTDVVVQSCQVIGKGDSIVNEHTTLEAQGGGLASLTSNGNVTITESTFTGNSATGGNGGNFNNANAGWAKGGSVYFEGGILEVQASRIERSTAVGGNGGNQDQNGQTNGGFGGTAQGGGVWIGGGAANFNNTTFKSTVATGGNSGTGGNGANPGGNADGGAIYTLGNVKVSNSTFHLAGATGGNGGDAFGTFCFGAHNAGDGGGARGGAIFADGGTLLINTATFANNFAAGGHGGDGGQTNSGLNCGMHGAGGLAHGGAVANNNAATVDIKHGTISLNNAQAGNTGVNQGGANKPPRPAAEGAGGGIKVGPASVTLQNTIIAGNTAANGLGDASGAPTPGPNVDGTISSIGHNLIGVATEAVGFSGPGDKTGANPMLAAIADNGGPTQTMALNAGSAAIDAGVAGAAVSDQRGRPRTFNDPAVANAATSDATDIGAFERQPLCSLTCPADVNVSNDKGKCGAVILYKKPMRSGCGAVTCSPASGAFFPVGETTVTCNSAIGPTCSFKVTVKDSQPPTITTRNTVLWPPNHNYKTIALSGLVRSVTDNCGRRVTIKDVKITQATSDEVEDAPGGGDGNTSNDIVIAPDCKSIQLRAERQGSGNGRVYAVHLKVTDIAGNVSTAIAKVRVPQAQNGPVAVEDAAQYTVSSACP
ncbi:MAG TPA: choice-of-anchor Q domain-containing protein [Pyrinomonadaceae bacterium]|nr:choice-of-anchor Q domain-containing protein [Pyrinomonadaceae bacterium]